MFSKLKLLIACVCVAVASSAAYAQSDPYATLREAYAKGDAARAADAYHTDATYAEIYARIAPSVRAGMPAIRAGMEAFFRQLGVGPNDPADLNFRIVSRTTSDQLTRDTGYYRIAIGKGAKRQTFFGQFVTGWRDGKFQFDISGEANESDFEAAVGPLMFADEDEELSASYYDSLVGYFPKDASCGLLVTRSVRRLFLFDDCSGDWRGLSRVSGRVWTAGQKLIDPTPVDRYSFESDKLTRTGQLPQTLTKATPYLLEPVSFGDKVKLAGTVYQPTGATSRSAAIVLVHGSGPQDRNGYASYIALLAHHLARAGLIVLTYDKRGTGLSGGDPATAGFEALSADARVAMEYLRTRDDVDPKRVGLGGSSQAGWIAAMAIRDGGNPAFAMLVGAAGSALTVEEQNIYNTRVRMTCAGIASPQIKLALDQQRAFFAARRSVSGDAALARLSADAARYPALVDWLFPATVNRNGAGDWYDILDPDFDPLPIWRAYQGKAFFLFGSLDDSTPTTDTVRRIASIKNAQIKVLKDAQHLGLTARSLCASDVTNVSRFHPSFFSTLNTWAKSL